MSQLLRTNPGLLVWVILFAAIAMVCALVGIIMRRFGASLRPIYWFAGFVALPEHLGEFLRAGKFPTKGRTGLPAPLPKCPSSRTRRSATSSTSQHAALMVILPRLDWARAVPKRPTWRFASESEYGSV
jgi:hypothetical protein